MISHSGAAVHLKDKLRINRNWGWKKGEVVAYIQVPVPSPTFYLFSKVGLLNSKEREGTQRRVATGWGEGVEWQLHHYSVLGNAGKVEYSPYYTPGFPCK